MPFYNYGIRVTKYSLYMKLSHFGFNLPEERLAEHPTENRDESRLMVLDRATGKIKHKVFKDVIDYFEEDDVKKLFGDAGLETIELGYVLRKYINRRETSVRRRVWVQARFRKPLEIEKP